jgi:hypothetical protein
LLSSANHLILAGDLLGVIAGVMGYSAGGRGEGGREVREQVRLMLDKYGGLADRLSLSGQQEQEPEVSIEALRQAELSCLRRWQTNPELGRGAMAVVMAGEWAQNLASLETDLEDAVSTAVDAARKPWWR